LITATAIAGKDIDTEASSIDPKVTEPEIRSETETELLETDSV